MANVNLVRKPATDTNVGEGSFRDILPAGVVFPYAGSAAPDGWLLCDGSAISRTIYSRLFNIIGTTYGSGDGSTTFNVPNTQGIFLRGAGSQTISAISYSATIGIKQNDATKKNGLTATASASSVTGTIGNATDGTHTHGFDNALRIASSESFAGGGNGGEGANSGSATGTNAIGSGHTHNTHSLTAAAQTITIAGDAETRPANISMQHIIKI